MFDYLLTSIAARPGCTLIMVTRNGAHVGYIAGDEYGGVYACNMQDDPGTVHEIPVDDASCFLQVMHRSLSPQAFFSGDVPELLNLIG